MLVLTMVLQEKGPKQVSARFVARQFANSLDANFYSWARGSRECSLAMALSKDLTTPMPEGDPVCVEPPKGLYEHNGTVWFLKRMNTSLQCSHHDLVSHDHKHSQLFSWISRATCSLQCTSMI